MGSFNSKAASNEYPKAINLSKANKNNREQRKEDGESMKVIGKCAKSDGDIVPTQGPEMEEDACATERSQNPATSDSKRTVPSYLWLVSSPISQDEENMMNESAVNYTTPGPSTSRSEPMKSVRFKPLFSYPKVGLRTETKSTSAVTAPFNDTRVVRNSTTSRPTTSAMMDKAVLTRSVGFGVERSITYPGHRFNALQRK